MSFSGSFGRFELGRRAGAQDLMYVGGEDAQAGTGGIDGDSPNAAKATLHAARLAGLQLGASFTPDYDDDGGDNRFRGDDAEARTGSAQGPTGSAGSVPSA